MPIVSPILINKQSTKVLIWMTLGLLSLIFIQRKEAQANLGSVQVAVAVERKERNFRYAYTLSYMADGTSHLPLGFFRIDLRHKPEEHPIAEQDLPPGFSEAEHMRELDETPRVIPTNKAAPQSWDHKYVLEKPSHGWWSCPIWNPTGQIKPGQKLSGFIFLAIESPGIRGFVATAFDAENTEEHVGKTLAPVAAPNPFTVSSWTFRMFSDAQEARKQGWIKTDEQFSKIKSLIEGLKVTKKRKLKSAVRKIERYVEKEVKAGRLTSEADALVRLNALYLLKRVKEDPKILKRK